MLKDCDLIANIDPRIHTDCSIVYDGYVIYFQHINCFTFEQKFGFALSGYTVTLIYADKH